MRYLWLAFGWLALTVGLIGILLPVMPTVPFLLVAVWAFARSSPRIGARIMRHPRFGPPIRAWRKRGVVGRNAKIWATTAMTCGVAWSLWLGLDPKIVAVQALTCSAIAVWLVTRPER
ncbi:YbaN family protein [Paracoccus sp. MBLB3053]|uniref:YbaN family protein n=1 Tax=Paracoccus aurantius TaxID=3073814 RepID=A0ABU2HP55_9RHOB|nr:YbaN family protein [Paracoccus sp. MBLB3053]MDS9466829.1 YbaN family protein [Paracoccus sp. MBLB3053]